LKKKEEIQGDEINLTEVLRYRKWTEFK